jgi:glycosyltransferase involved in cell wall biosynthesis
VAWLRALTRAGSHPVVRRLYDLFPVRLKNAVRARLWARAAGGGVASVPMTARTAPDVASPVLRTAVPIAGPGVNLIGFAAGGLGLSENFRGLARALREVAYPTALLDAGVLDAGRNVDLPADIVLGDMCPYGIDVVCVNPDQFERAQAATAVARRKDAYRIGFWFWELETVPAAWQPAIDAVDEIWVATPFVRDAFAAVADKPVTLVRMPVQPPALPAPDTADGAPFVFLFSFDFHSYVDRKNPQGVIDAFRRAFPRGDEPVRLVLKSHNGDVFRPQLYALMESVAKDDRIELRDGYLPRNDMLGLLARADAYVSLHRSEGFGLGMAEAMAMGKAVVGTGYSGNLEFMTPETSRLVRFARVPAPAGAYMYADDGVWAEPDLDDAASIMRELAGDRAAAAELGAKAALHMKQTHSAAVAGRIAMNRLETIRASMTAISTGNTP